MAHHDMQQKLLMEKNHREMMTNAMERQRMMMNEGRRPGMGASDEPGYMNQANHGGAHPGMGGYGSGRGAMGGFGAGGGMQ